jgi:hypothetical protein
VAPRIEELEAMTDEELRTTYNEIALNTAVGLEWYRGELQRRSVDRQTSSLARVTWAISVLTFANVVLVAWTLFE